MLDLSGDILKPVRRLLRLPPFARILARLARVIEPVFGSREENDQTV
jgi:hypothetical protein